MKDCKSGKSTKKDTNIFVQILIIVIATVLIFHYIYENSSLFYRKSITLPFSLHLNCNDLVMVRGEEFHLHVFTLHKWISYSSTNFRVAGVNFNGRIFAHQTGKAFILVKADDRVLKCRVRVIDINNEKLTLKVGDTFHLKIKGIMSAPSWKSSNSNVASVNLFGKVKAKEIGTTVITAKVKGKTVQCKVAVTRD